MSNHFSARQRFALTALVVAMAGAAGTSVFAATPIPGAIFTAKSVINPCDTVNSNIYEDKASVFINGGPKGPTGPALPSSTPWYVQVTDPSGATVLGSSVWNPTPPSTTPVATNALGQFATCYRLIDIVSLSAGGALGYADTPNLGGEYKVWVSEVATFDPDLTKTDNFKVKNGIVLPPQDSGRITIRKFYDANANGKYDDGEQEIFGWKVDLIDKPAKNTSALYEPLADGQYVAEEYTPVQPNWYATWVSLNGGTPLANSSSGPLILNSAPVTLATAGINDVTVAFGNVCTGAGGGYTLGYWSNKNGEASIKSMGTAGTMVFLTQLNLKTATGADFDPSLAGPTPDKQYTAFRNWLLNGNAVYMPYMLSVQLATMELNVKFSPSVGNQLIYAPGTFAANTAGFATVQAVMDEANASLGGNGITFPGVKLRNYQEYLKNALDNANNNKTFVQPAPCASTFLNPVL